MVDPDFRYGDPIVNPKNMTPHDLTQGPMDARRIFYGWGSITGARFPALSMAATQRMF